MKISKVRFIHPTDIDGRGDFVREWNPLTHPDIRAEHTVEGVRFHAGDAPLSVVYRSNIAAVCFAGPMPVAPKTKKRVPKTKKKVAKKPPVK